MSEKISIIVPVYNAEKYIEKCIQSIIDQTYTNIELLLVDDGSNDESLSIIKSWEKKDARIKVIQQENSGVSAARNAGLREATGRFIQFIDSDDTISLDFCCKMINIIGDADLCVCGINEIVDETIVKSKKLDMDENNQQKTIIEIAFMLYEADLLNSPGNKLYKKELISDMFLENMAMGEDLLFNLRYLENCKSISVLPMCLYQYVRNPKSATGKFRKNMGFMQCNIYQNLYCFFDKMPIECITYIDNRFFEHMVQLVFKRALISRNEPRRDRLYCVNEGLDNELFKSLMRRFKPKTFKDIVWTFVVRTRLICWGLI